MQVSATPLRVKIEHLKDESYANDDIMKVSGISLLQSILVRIPV